MTHDDLLQAIIERPDDDAPRLIFADWLEDHGEPERAAFIRVQLDLAKVAEKDERRHGLEEREKELLARHEEEWVRPVRLTRSSSTDRIAQSGGSWSTPYALRYVTCRTPAACARSRKSDT